MIASLLRWYALCALASPTTPNSLVGLPGGTAAYAAMTKLATVNSVMFQPVVPIDVDGHLWQTRPTYVAETIVTSLGASGRNPLAMYNSSFTNVTVQLEAILAQKNMAAVTGIAFNLALSRITSLGPVGTGVGSVGGAPVPVASFDPSMPTSPNSLWFTNLVSGSAVGGVTSLYNVWMHSEETNVAAQLQEVLPIWPPFFANTLRIPPLRFPPGYGFALTIPTSTAAGAYTFTAIYSVSSGTPVF